MDAEPDPRRALGLSHHDAVKNARCKNALHHIIAYPQATLTLTVDRLPLYLHHET